MSMQVGLTNSGSAAHNFISRPSATVKEEAAFSGGSCAGTAAGTISDTARQSSCSRYFMADRNSEAGRRNAMKVSIAGATEGVLVDRFARNDQPRSSGPRQRLRLDRCYLLIRGKSICDLARFSSQ